MTDEDPGGTDPGLGDTVVRGVSTAASVAGPGDQGLEAFFGEDYVAAARLFARAAIDNPADSRWRELQAQAESNARNRYQDGLTTIPFSRRALLEPPALALREPLDLQPMPAAPGFVQSVLDAGNKLLGILLSPGVTLAIRVIGGKGREQSWLKWPTRKQFLLRDLGLAAIRNYMNHNTLQDPYGGQLTGNQNPGQRRPEWTERYRTATGAWNTDNPMEGAAGTRFIWQGNEISPRVNTMKDRRTPLEVADKLLHVPEGGRRSTVDFLNLLAVAWIQFVLHDWVNHRQTGGDEIRLPFPDKDPRIGTYDRTGITFRRTQPAIVGANPFAYENEVTAWWDGSQIYGSDQFTQDRLRARDQLTWLRLLEVDHDNRRLKRQPASGAYDSRRDLAPDGKLFVENDQPPIDGNTGVIDSGFTRNMWVGLELLHTLFVRHHNWLCDRYAEEHPEWSSDQIFNHARLENAATMAKIHTIEWTPAALPTEELTVGMSSNWHGMLETLRRPFEDRKPLRLLNPVHPLLGGLVGGETNNFGVAQNFSEQFVEVYRLHAAMPDEIELRDIAGDAHDRVPVERTRSAGSRKTIADHQLETLINSFGHQHMHALVNNNYPAFMRAMSGEGAPLVDLGAIDIARARERGIPRFNEFRRQLGMPAIDSFKELTSCQQTIDHLTWCYGDGTEGVERLDVTVGMLCDTRSRPLRGFDNTRFAIFLQAASRRLQADAFFTEKYNERYYTKAGLARIDRMTMKRLLLLHFPALKHSGLMRIHNAFEPWGTTSESAPDEHPLAFIERYRERLP